MPRVLHKPPCIVCGVVRVYKNNRICSSCRYKQEHKQHGDPRICTKCQMRERMGNQTWCRECHRAYYREWHRAHGCRPRRTARCPHCGQEHRTYLSSGLCPGCRIKQRNGTLGRTKLCAACHRTFSIRDRRQRYCSQECRAKAGNFRCDGRRKLQKPYRQLIHKRDNWMCYLCGGQTDRTKEWPHPLSPSVDHVKPVSAGGTDDPSNLRTAHWACNEAKGDSLLGIELGLSFAA